MARNGSRQQRRAAQLARRRRAAGADGSGTRRRPGAPPTRDGQQAHDPPEPLEALLQAVVWSWQGDPPAHAELLERLDRRAAQGEPVMAAVRRRLDDTLPRLWEHGWTPVDVVHVTTRRLSATHAAVAAHAVLADGRARDAAGETLHARWRAQLDVLEAHAGDRAPARAALVRTAVTVLALLTRLPTVPVTMPAPGSPDAALSGVEGLDQRTLARVRALLAKAESTDFEEEAEALTTKAQELIARHAIAEALLHTPGDVGQPSLRRVHLDDPYSDAKASLLSQIADANRCTAVHTPDFGWVTVFGYERDLDAVELLAASLLAQATSAMVRHGPRRDASGRSTTRSFRRSFLLGFALRIGERLRAATDGQVSAATAAQRGQLLPVLAAREDQLRAARDAAFPNAVSRRTSVSNATGWSAGQAAADLADLDVSAGAIDR